MTPSKHLSTQQVSQVIPEAARVILVPVANPSTAADLLHLAAALVHPEEGKIIALMVSLGDAEGEASAFDALQAALEQVQAEGLDIQLEKIVSTSVSRGILDMIRETGADLVVIGINKNRAHKQSSLGTVVESVLDTAACDVLVYRPASQSAFKRVVLPVNVTFQAQVAARLGIRLAKYYGIHIEAMYPQSSSRSQVEGLANIEYAIAGVPGREIVRRTVVTAHDPVEAILARTNEDDLIVVGFGERSEFERWIFGDMARGMLNRAAGPVIMVSRSLGKRNGAVRLGNRLLNWLRPTLTRIEQDEIVREANVLASMNIDYATLIVVSAALATLGLLLDSVAVIIGAMLVAPLMQPLIALATGIVVGRVDTAQRALVTLVLGVLTALVMAFVLGTVLPISAPTTEMLARGSPSLLDAVVALASGVVGAYATARKDIPAALAGVAIAAALMPPVCTIGLGLALGDADLAFGAALLFLTNIVCIISAGVIVFGWLGMRIQEYEYVSSLRQWVALALLLVVTLALGGKLLDLTRQATEQNTIRREVETAFAPAEVVGFDAVRGAASRYIVTVRSDQVLTVEDVQAAETHILSH